MSDSTILIEEVKLHQIYYTRLGYRFKVTRFLKHGQDCSIRMIEYINLDRTPDSKIGTYWTIEESVFLKRFFHREYETRHLFFDPKNVYKPISADRLQHLYGHDDAWILSDIIRPLGIGESHDGDFNSIRRVA